jgi:hypothetical protein
MTPTQTSCSCSSTSTGPHLRLSDLGFEKGQTFITEPNITKVMDKAQRYL